jgi:hypothetical protein
MMTCTGNHRHCTVELGRESQMGESWKLHRMKDKKPSTTLIQKRVSKFPRLKANGRKRLHQDRRPSECKRQAFPNLSPVKQMQSNPKYQGEAPLKLGRWKTLSLGILPIVKVRSAPSKVRPLLQDSAWITKET